MHAWVAKGSEPAVFAFVLIDAEPVEKAGKKLTTHSRRAERRAIRALLGRRPGGVSRGVPRSGLP
jgi:hypothetical protein